MSITTKDFNTIADALRSTKPADEASSLMTQWAYDCITIADALEQLNPRFRRDLFLAACRGD